MAYVEPTALQKLKTHLKRKIGDIQKQIEVLFVQRDVVVQILYTVDVAVDAETRKAALESKNQTGIGSL